jgi:hypothetical protein
MMTLSLLTLRRPASRRRRRSTGTKRAYFPPTLPRVRQPFYGGSVSAAQNLTLLLSEQSHLHVPINLVWFATVSYPLEAPPESCSGTDESQSNSDSRHRESRRRSFGVTRALRFFRRTADADLPDAVRAELRRQRAAHELGFRAIKADLADYPKLIREVVGSPYRPVAVCPGWRSEAVLQLARSIYDRRTFEALRTLADALEDAGCSDRELLMHCRGSGPHVRGCWALDLVLGLT